MASKALAALSLASLPGHPLAALALRLGPQSSLQSVDLTELFSDYPRHGCVPDLGKWNAGHNYLETSSSMPQPAPGACQHFWAFCELLSNFPRFHSFRYPKQVSAPKDALQVLASVLLF